MHVINFLENEKYDHKRIGYITLPLVADPSGQELIMATNHFKKEMKKGQVYEISAGLNCLANVLNVTLASQLHSDVMTLHNNIAKAVIRKKTSAILAISFRLYPEAIKVNLENVVKRISTEASTSNSHSHDY
jgi:hypothetical protein